MHAFVERLPCGVHVFFRAGPLAKEYGDPWVWGCLGEIIENDIRLFGYEKENQPAPTPEVIKAWTRAAIGEGFKSVILDRHEGRAIRTLIFTATEEGKITMGKTHDTIKALKVTDHVKNGKIDQEKVSATIKGLVALHDAKKTECTYLQHGEWIDEKGRIGFEAVIRGIVLSD